jgi:hypothetical protein
MIRQIRSNTSRPASPELIPLPQICHMLEPLAEEIARDFVRI